MGPTYCREVRRIDADALNELCEREGWCDKSDPFDYEDLLIHLAEEKENLATADIIAIAENIASHSSKVYNDERSICMIATKVAKAATTVFVTI